MQHKDVFTVHANSHHISDTKLYNFFAGGGDPLEPRAVLYPPHELRSSVDAAWEWFGYDD